MPELITNDDGSHRVEIRRGKWTGATNSDWFTAVCLDCGWSSDDYRSHFFATSCAHEHLEDTLPPGPEEEDWGENYDIPGWEDHD